MLELLWLLLPEGAEILVVVGVAFALMLGLISRGKAASMLGGLVLVLLITPFIPALLDALPWWASLLFLLWMVTSTLGLLGRLFLGKRAWSHVKGRLAWSAVRTLARALWWCVAAPFRLGWRAVKWLGKRPPSTPRNHDLERMPKQGVSGSDF